MNVKKPDILFYCGINENNWSHHPVAPGPYACIAPVYGRSKRTKVINNVSVPAATQVILDSGAFSDTTDTRLSFEKAFFRQVAHAYRFGYVRQVTHIASYDFLVARKELSQSFFYGRKQYDKETWSAVNETVAAATYLSKHRKTISGIFMHPVGLILTAQGIDAEQYLYCAQKIVPMIGKDDIFGFGGFAATGLYPGVMLPPFKEVVRKVVPYVGTHGIKRIHIWGVCLASALVELLFLCKKYDIALSTDSSGPQRRPILAQWGYSSWYDTKYKMPPLLASCKALDSAGNKKPTCVPGTFCRGLERARHVEATREWLTDFRGREQIKDIYA